ncbi:MAG: DUF6644 family protein [Steroidobacteraceae bacterium]
MLFESVTDFLGDLEQRVWWVFPGASTVHFIGLSLLVGSILLIDLRALGVIRRVPYAAVMSLTKVAVVGLLLNVFSGLVMFASRPADYWHAWPFRYKMMVILIAVLNALWFTGVGHRKLSSLPSEAGTPLAIKASAVLSLAAWLVVILLGRSIFEFTAGG